MELEIITQNPETSPRTTPVLFVHGAWHGAWCWKENFLPYFTERGYTSHALSLRGHGASQSPARFRLARIADYAADVAQVVEQLPQPPVLVGHSMGGLVVQKYLEEHTVPAAVLLASVPVRGVLRATLRIALRHPLAFLKANLTWSLYPIVGKPELCREAFFSADISNEKLEVYFSRIQDESYLAFLDMMMFNLPNPKRVETNLLILGADKDTIFYPDEIEATAKAYQTQSVMFPGMAHDMMLEHGWESVADRIVNWLEEKGL
jgi:pimeloyl-ACP methyl ester carboxylesterase